MLSPDTERLVAACLAVTDYPTADELVRDALRAFVLPPGVPSGPPTDEELDAALDEADRGGGIPWEQARAELAARFGLRLDP